MIRIMSEPKSNYPRDLEEDFKLFARSTPEVFEIMGAIVSRVAAERSILFKGRLRPKKAQVMNAIILYMETLTPSEQVASIRVGMDMLNEILRQPLDDPEVEKPVEGSGSKGKTKGSQDLGSGGTLGPAIDYSPPSKKRGSGT